MTLDPEVVRLREEAERADLRPLYTLSLAEARRADLASITANAGRPEPVDRITDRFVPHDDSPVPIRVYRPSGRGPFPVLVYFFGGGWTLGTIDTSDAICRRLTNAAGCVTVAVGYRLAPEHRFPTAVHDCHAAVRWIAEHGAELDGDTARLAVAGDSSGGNLAAAVTLLSRADGPPITAQVLVYPATDQLSDSDSLRENNDPVFFNARSVAWYRSHYLKHPADASDPLASPLRAPDLQGLPPALVITAEHDPLRDEGEQYARRLGDDGVPVRLSRYPGMIHGFFAMSGTLAGGRQAMHEVAEYLRDSLAPTKKGLS